MEKMNKIDLKYCCEDFKGENNLPEKRHYPAIKICKEKNKKRFYITVEPIEKKIADTRKIEIKFCPYCGMKLSRFYKSDDYIDEIF